MFAQIVRIMISEFMRSIMKHVAIRIGADFTRITGEKVAKTAFEALINATYKEINTACFDAAKAGVEFIKKMPYNIIHNKLSVSNILEKVFSKTKITTISHTIKNGIDFINNADDFSQYLKDWYITEYTELKEFDSYITDHPIKYDNTTTTFGDKTRNTSFEGVNFVRQGNYFVKKEDLEKYREELREYNRAIKNREHFEKNFKQKMPKPLRDLNQWNSQKEWSDYLNRLELAMQRKDYKSYFKTQEIKEESIRRRAWYAFMGTNKGYSKSAFENLLKKDSRLSMILRGM